MIELALVLFSYLLGSFQPGLLIVRLTHRIDVRNFGSGKTGVTNVLRTAGKKHALVVLLLDVGKGLAVVVLAKAFFEDPLFEAAVGMAVILGHVFPVFFKFKGGRGVATGFGAATGLFALPSLFGLFVFLPVIFLTRFVSLGSILSVVTVMMGFGIGVIWGDLPWEYVIFSSTCGVLIIYMHKDNIARLFQGTERKIGHGS